MKDIRNQIDIFKINKLCKSCGQRMQVEKWTEENTRFKIITCENHCFSYKTSKPVPDLNIFGHYINVGDKSYLSNQNDNGYFYETKLVEHKGLKVEKFGWAFKKEDLLK